MADLPPRLNDMRQRIEAHARAYGLDFFDVVFEVLDYEQINMVAAYGGFPNRYPHWRFGMEYEQLSKGYEYGLQKIYEMVINNDPSYAYLLESNEDVDQKIVMAHVFGHVDFFKNNFAFQHTNRKMMDDMANHATRVRRYIDRYGIDAVEDFIDRCLSIDNLIDPQALHVRRTAPRADPESEPIPEVRGIEAGREYLRPYINPPEFLEQQRRKLELDRLRKTRFPERPQRDVLLFLIEHAPLENWQRDILTMIRDEAAYFAPQGQTKIMNEGWASYWHARILTEKALRDEELIDFADHHAGVLATRPGHLNPYKLGIELWRDIEQRWNTGRHGKEYEECDSLEARRRWNTGENRGREKMFEVRRLYNDVTFIDTFLTPEFCVEHKLFTFGFNDRANHWEIVDREFRKVKHKLLSMLTNFGQPMIDVVDANHDNRGELLLQHQHEGVDLKHDHMRDTLRNVQAIWKRPVLIATRIDGKPVIHRFDGTDHSERKGGPAV